MIETIPGLCFNVLFPKTYILCTEFAHYNRLTLQKGDIILDYLLNFGSKVDALFNLLVELTFVKQIYGYLKLSVRKFKTLRIGMPRGQYFCRNTVHVA